MKPREACHRHERTNARLAIAVLCPVVLSSSGVGMSSLGPWGISATPPTSRHLNAGLAIPATVASIQVGNAPLGAAYDQRNGYVYVVNQGSSNVSILSGTALVGSVTVGSDPRWATYDDQNGYVYVPSFFSDNVTVINGTKVVGSVSTGFYAQYATYNSGNGYVYVTLHNATKVLVLNGTSIVGWVNVGAQAWFGTYDTGNGYVYISNTQSSNVSVIDGTKVVGSVNVGMQPSFPAYDKGNGYVYVPNPSSDNVSVINGTKLVATVSLGAGSRPFYATYDESNGFVYLSNTADGVHSGTVGVVNGTTLVGSIAVGADPAYSASDSCTGQIFVPNTNDGNVSVIDGTSGLGSISLGGTVLGGDPTWATYDEGNGYVYVTNHASHNVSVIAAQSCHTVTFSEVGLPGATGWSVTLGGTQQTSTSANIAFARPNGTYSYVVGTLSGYSANPASGSVTVGGADKNVAVTFTLQPTYPVTFTETGLPSAASWSANFSGILRGSTGNSIAFAEPNGTYSFLIGPVLWYHAAPSTGTVVVSGSARGVSITFQLQLFPVSFLRHGPDGPPSWTVTLAGVSNSSSGSTIGFEVPNGTNYPFQITWPAGCVASLLPSEGTLNVSGTQVTVSIDTGPPPPCPPPVPPGYAVTFGEIGLPSGTGWWVTFDGVPKAATGNVTFAQVPNGTYPFSVGSVAGYASSPTNGSITVAGVATSLSVRFTASPSNAPTTFLGLPAWDAFGLLSGVIPALVVGVAIVVILRKGRRKPSPGTPGSPSAPGAGGPPATP